MMGVGKSSPYVFVQCPCGQNLMRVLVFFCIYLAPLYVSMTLCHCCSVLDVLSVFE